MLATLSICLSLLSSVSPADEVRAAAADVQQLPPEVRPATRYLSLDAIAPADQNQAVQVTAYVLNALSRSRSVSQPARVSPTLLRFSIADFAPENDEFTEWFNAWEKLAQADPYFHLQTEIIAPSNPAKQKVSSKKPAANESSPGSAVKTVTIDGGWADPFAAAQLRAATHSSGALLRADYFVTQATTTPSYYQFAGVPDSESDFLKSLGVNRDVIDRLRADAGANLAVSGVTAKPRRIVWLQGPLGGVYATLDVERVDAQRDPLRRPITAAGFTFRYDLGEWFAVAPNGLWRTALFNAAGRRQDSVPDRVAKDTSDSAADGIVVPLISCIRCHREAGLRPFIDDETKLLGGHVDFYSSDPHIIQRAIEFYDDPRLERQMEFDRQTYRQAVSRATNGLKAEELADALAKVVREYAFVPVSLPQAAREVGSSEAEFREALQATHDPVILLLLEGHSVLRGQWESSFAEAALAAQTYRARMSKP